jgi:hypothetical protein
LKIEFLLRFKNCSPIAHHHHQYSINPNNKQWSRIVSITLSLTKESVQTAIPSPLANSIPLAAHDGSEKLVQKKDTKGGNLNNQWLLSHTQMEAAASSVESKCVHLSGCMKEREKKGWEAIEIRMITTWQMNTFLMSARMEHESCVRMKGGESSVFSS